LKNEIRKLRYLGKNRDLAFLGMLEINPSHKVIDLGCGDGCFSVRVKERVGCNEILGVDLCDEFLKKAEEKGITVKKADLDSALPFEQNFFDVIVSNQVIEHLFYPVKFMKEIHRLLKPHGYAVISTENLASWDNIGALLFGYSPFSMQYDDGLCKIGNPLSPHEKELKNSHIHSHVRIFTWNSICELARFLCFRVDAISVGGHLLGKIGEALDKKHCRFITLKLRK
jgi:SAM-dependent methyltransferase